MHALVRMTDAQGRDRVLWEFNASTLDSVGPVDQTMAILKEIDELQSGHDEFVKSLAPRVDIV
jgi:hypothetical protein